MKRYPKILFILKKRMTSHSGLYTISSGLLNSANFVHKMLYDEGIISNLVEVRDNNDIDREVTEYRPDIVVIEALWVVPSKFEVLQKLHPNVTWIIRLHSEIPFIANEGIAMDWIYQYQKYDNVFISINSKTTYKDLSQLLTKPIIYLPNYYPVKLFKFHKRPKPNCTTIDIGCFGAIRPLKNQLYQAVAAIQFANETNKTLNFHINNARVENNGDPVYKNIKKLFENNPKHNLIEHGWLNHKDFLKLVQTMDLGLQVSFSETFNIVAADFVNCDVPIVVSEQIKWASDYSKAIPTSSNSIKEKMYLALKASKLNLQFVNKIKLNTYSKESKKEWLSYLKKFKKG